MLTVLTPATSQNLATLDTAKDELGVVGTADDAMIGRLIAQASDEISSFCDRVFIAETVRETFNFDACLWHGNYWRYSDEPLKLARRPVISITSVTEDDGAVLAADYELDADRGLLWRRRGELRGSWWARRIVIEYQGGYQAADVPPALERACLDLVKRSFYGRGRDPALRSETVPGIIEQTFTAASSETTAGGVPQAIADSIWRFRAII